MCHKKAKLAAGHTAEQIEALPAAAAVAAEEAASGQDDPRQ